MPISGPSTPLTSLLARQLCRSCRKKLPTGFLIRPEAPQTRSYSSLEPNINSGESSSSSSRARPRLRYIPLSLFILPPVLWYLSQGSPSSDLSPRVYSDHPVKSTRKVSEQHKEVVIALNPSSASAFSTRGPGQTLSNVEGGVMRDGTITVHHVMVKSPDLMIERPYTPLNDVAADGEIKLVVKRVKGGEVGRLVHSLQPGQNVGLRGPIPTFSLDPSRYDRIIMISSGTGIAPFLQFLSKLSSARTPESTGPANPSGPTRSPDHLLPHFDIIHALPSANRTDWVSDPNTSPLPALEAQFRDRLTIRRYAANTIPAEQVSSVLRVNRGGAERTMVLVCLPPNLMRPLCGSLTVTMQQGEVSGLLKDLGLTSDEVWKLE